jgi:hypothetical protein
MNGWELSFLHAILIGLGATLTFDLWGLLLKSAFGIAPSNICLVGRWLLYMPAGTFRHARIASSAPKRGECAAGWIGHYAIGVAFAVAFVTMVGNRWIQHPTPVPSILYGVVTVCAPFAIMQPAFGLGFAASKVANPGQARWRSLMNHAAFGVGLYLSELLVGLFLHAPA